MNNHPIFLLLFTYTQAHAQYIYTMKATDLYTEI